MKNRALKENRSKEKIRFIDSLSLLAGIRVSNKKLSSIDINFMRDRQISLSLKTAFFTAFMSLCFAIILAGSLYFPAENKAIVLRWGATLAFTSCVILLCLRVQKLLYDRNRLSIVKFMLPLLIMSVINGVLWGLYPAMVVALLGFNHNIADVVFGGVMLASVTWGFPFFTLTLAIMSCEVVGYVLGYILFLGGSEGDYSNLAVFFLLLHFFLVAIVIYSGFHFIEWAQKQLLLSHEKQIISLVLKDFEETTSDWLWQTDEFGFIDYTSENFLPVLGLNDVQMGSLQLIDVFDSDCLEVLQLRNYMLNRRDFIGLVIPLESGGEKKWLKLTGKAVFDQKKHFVGYRGVGSDITTVRNFKIAEEEKRRFAAISEMSGSLSHDFNNLLSSVLLRLELVEKSRQLDCEHHRYLDEAIQTCFEAAHITRQMLAASRKETIEPENISIARLLKKIKMEVLKKHPTIMVRIECERDFFVWADRMLLRNALDNIVHNAIRAVSESELPCIAINVYQQMITNENVEQYPSLGIGNYICINVIDSGPGFSDSELARAFEPFFTQHRCTGGSGLGLSMVKGFALQSAGYVSIENTQQGAKVSMCLPVGFKLNQPQLSNAVMSIEKGHNFLIVEDYESLSNIIAEHMRLNAIRFVIARSVSEALEYLNSDPSIDFIITDIMLPDGNGSDIVKTARHRTPNIGVIYISGFSDFSIEHKELSAPLIRKPFKINQLIQAINACAVVSSEQALCCVTAQ